MASSRWPWHGLGLVGLIGIGFYEHMEHMDMHMNALRRQVALETHRPKLFLQASPVELINADSTNYSQRNLNKTIAGWKKSSVAWGVGVWKFP